MLGLAFLVLLVLAAALSPVIFDYEKDVIGQNMRTVCGDRARLTGLEPMNTAVTYLPVLFTARAIP